MVTVSHSSVFEFSRWGEFCKEVSAVAWVLRLIRDCKLRGDKYTGPLTYEELNKAKMKLFQSVQRETYGKKFETIPPSFLISKLDPFHTCWYV